MHKGKRYNKGKLRLDLVPPEAIIAIAKVLQKGAEKYDERNWEKGMNWMETLACGERHILKWKACIDEGDEETGLPHLWHALVNLAMLVTFEIRGIGEDSRMSLEGARKLLESDQGEGWRDSLPTFLEGTQEVPEPGEFTASEWREYLGENINEG